MPSRTIENMWSLLVTLRCYFGGFVHTGNIQFTFIYALRDPRTLEIRYIGKSDKPTHRLWYHVSNTRKEKNRKSNWIKSLKAKGLRPILEIIDEVDKATWQAAESAYIIFYTEQGCDLVNGTLGGDGTGAGKDSPNFGRTVSPEQRERLKQAWVELPPEKKAARVAAHTTPEARAKRKATLRGKKRPLEVVAKMREAERNRTPEQRALRKAKAKRIWNTPERRAERSARTKLWWDREKERRRIEQGQLTLPYVSI